ncbi:MAG: hypothetical protein ACI84B_001735 [Oceanospirillaceae bacterium]
MRTPCQNTISPHPLYTLAFSDSFVFLKQNTPACSF